MATLGVLISATACLLFSVRKLRLACLDSFGIRFFVNANGIHLATTRETAAMDISGIKSFVFVYREVHLVNLLNVRTTTLTSMLHHVRAFATSKKVTARNFHSSTALFVNADGIHAIQCGLAKVSLTGNRVSASVKERSALKATISIRKRAIAFVLNIHAQTTSFSTKFSANALKKLNSHVHPSFSTMPIFVDAFAIKQKNVPTVLSSTTRCANAFAHDPKFAHQIKFGTKKAAVASAERKSCATRALNLMSSNVLAFVLLKWNAKRVIVLIARSVIVWWKFHQRVVTVSSTMLRSANVSAPAACSA